eukprot:12130227-Alexandrium_andersonii.AAC.1
MNRLGVGPPRSEDLLPIGADGQVVGDLREVGDDLPAVGAASLGRPRDVGVQGGQAVIVEQLMGRFRQGATKGRRAPTHGDRAGRSGKAPLEASALCDAPVGGDNLRSPMARADAVAVGAGIGHGHLA